MVLIDLIIVPYGLSLKEKVTEQAYAMDFYGIPKDMQYEHPEDVKTAENSLVNSFKATYPRDIISSESFLDHYAYRNDSTTAGYWWKWIPVYAIFIYRTYDALSQDGNAVLTWTAILDVIIILMIVIPSYEKVPTDFLKCTYNMYERRYVPFIPSNDFISIMSADGKLGKLDETTALIKLAD